MASLLPTSTPSINGKPASGIGKDGAQATEAMLTGTAAQQSNSKANTVEVATEYIKSLQQELKDIKGKLEIAERKLEAKVESSEGDSLK